MPFKRSNLTAINTVLNFGSPKQLDAIALLLLIVLAVYWSLHGVDAARFTNADALYPVQLMDFSILSFRPPPSNNFFPDVLLHALLATGVSDPLTQKLAVGVTLFILSAVLIGLYKPYQALLLFLFIFATSDYYFFDSTAHFSLPLCLLLYQLSTRRILNNLVLFAIVFSDLIILLPLAVSLIALESNGRLKEKIVIAMIAAVLNVLYAEFSVSAALFFPVLGLFIASLWIAKRLGLVQLMCLTLTVVLPLLALLGLLPGRYTAPVAAAIMLLLFPLRSAQFNWRIVVLPAAVVALFFSHLDQRITTRLDTAYVCLANTLKTRGLTAIAADHWSAKPLYFATRDIYPELVITQVDFAEADVQLWMAPYTFYGTSTVWGIRSQHACTTITRDTSYCGQSDTAPLIAREKLCAEFELFQYEQTLPLGHAVKPANKIQSIMYHFKTYFNKAMTKL